MATEFLLRSDDPLCTEVVRYHSESILNVPLRHQSWHESFTNAPLCVIHDSPPEALDSNGRFTDATTLTDWQHDHTTHIVLLPESQTALHWPRADKVFFKPIVLNELFTLLAEISQNYASRARKATHKTIRILSNQEKTYLFDENTRQLFQHTSREVALSDQEKAFLALLVAERGGVVSKTLLHRRLMGLGEDAQTHSIETLVYRLRRKLETDAAQPKLLCTQTNGYRLNVLSAD